MGGLGSFRAASKVGPCLVYLPRSKPCGRHRNRFMQQPPNDLSPVTVEVVVVRLGRSAEPAVLAQRLSQSGAFRQVTTWRRLSSDGRDQLFGRFLGDRVGGIIGEETGLPAG
jgi:hypothetical protein